MNKSKIELSHTRQVWHMWLNRSTWQMSNSSGTSGDRHRHRRASRRRRPALDVTQRRPRPPPTERAARTQIATYRRAARTCPLDVLLVPGKVPTRTHTHTYRHTHALYARYVSARRARYETRTKASRGPAPCRIVTSSPTRAGFATAQSGRRSTPPRPTDVLMIIDWVIRVRKSG